jgi:transcription initiation factor IIE alpha subunit
MKINLHDIWEGWRNNLIPPERLKKEIERVSRQRRNICNQCEYNSKFHDTWRPDIHCIECGCTLSAKTKCLSCDCPLSSPKWTHVLSEEQEDEINIKELKI